MQMQKILNHSIKPEESPFQSRVQPRKTQHVKLILTACNEPTIMKINGAGDKTRTYDLMITNQLLYQLSYTGLRWNAEVK